MLFKTIVNRKETQLAYLAEYGDWLDVKENPGAKDLVVWRKKLVYNKDRLSNFLNEAKTHLVLLNKNVHSSKYGVPQEWRIVWRGNNVPTEIEWNKKTGNYFITVDLRITKTSGRIAQFSF